MEMSLVFFRSGSELHEIHEIARSIRSYLGEGSTKTTVTVLRRPTAEDTLVSLVFSDIF